MNRQKSSRTSGSARPIDLVFVDSHHEEARVQGEFASLAHRANMIALHGLQQRLPRYRHRLEWIRLTTTGIAQRIH